MLHLRRQLDLDPSLVDVFLYRRMWLHCGRYHAPDPREYPSHSERNRRDNGLEEDKSVSMFCHYHLDL